MFNITVLVNVGRRIPKSWFRRQGNRVVGLISFQENLWQIIKQSLGLAKKKANASGKLDFMMTNDREDEDLNYEIEWIKIIIRGSREQEQEEYEEALQMYQPLGKILKREMPKDERLERHFKSKILNNTKVHDAYEKGYGASDKNNISNKLLEMGILTHMEWIDDFDSREVDYRPD